jgi:hypothetical protein
MIIIYKLTISYVADLDSEDKRETFEFTRHTHRGGREKDFEMHQKKAQMPPKEFLYPISLNKCYMSLSHISELYFAGQRSHI